MAKKCESSRLQIHLAGLVLVLFVLETEFPPLLLKDIIKSKLNI